MNWLRRNSSQDSIQATLPPATSPATIQDATATSSNLPARFANTMMDYPLTLQHIYNRALQFFPQREVVDVTADSYIRSSYGQVCNNARRIASALHALGIARGDRVGTLAWNTICHLELYLAIPCMGAVLHTLNLRLASDQLAFIIQDAGDSVIFVDADLLPLLDKIPEALKDVKLLVVMNGSALATTSQLPPIRAYEDLIANAPADYSWPELDERDACAMCYTSGTTGYPKGVVYSHRSSFLHAMSLTMVDTHEFSGRDTFMPIVPMFHVNAWGAPYTAAMVGAKLVFPGRFMDPNRIAQTISDEHVTSASGVPTIWMGLLQVLTKRNDLDLSHVKRLICGGSAPPPALIAGFDKLGLKIVHSWGMTEMSPLGTVSHIRPELDELSYDERLAYRSKQGTPVPGVDLRIMNLDTGQEVPWDGETFGEIQVRGPWITGRYYRDDNMEQGESKFVDGWFRTGDVASIDHYGYIQIIDRTKDVIKSGGEWISSVQLENAIMGHPEVLEAAVVGVPHPKWQERPVAAIVPKPGIDADALNAESIRSYLVPLIAKWWLPDEIVVMSAIPKTSVGKFDKKMLREQLADRVKLGNSE
jgi:fatty-acyl-CoA synthase